LEAHSLTCSKMIDRTLTHTIRKALLQFPAVALIGSRQTGKTTLARIIADAWPTPAIYLDLELPSDLAKLGEPELYLGAHENTLVILDEIQRRPDLFPVLRGMIDRNRRPGRFLLLGSAAPELLRQSSETLAGRLIYLELTPFLLPEIAASEAEPDTASQRLWLRGGYPESFLARSDADSMVWRYAFLATFLERDVPQMGFRTSSTRIRRFWEMLAHSHAQLWNASGFARNFDVTAPMVRHYLDLLTDALLVRQLQPLHANLKKRLVKSHKVYIRDIGLLHALLRIPDRESLHGHPILGASFEGFAIEQIIQQAPKNADFAFYRTHTGEEIDLVVSLSSRQRVAIEVKYTASPQVSRGMRTAMSDLGITRGHVVTAGTGTFPLSPEIQAIPLLRLLNDGFETLL